MERPPQACSQNLTCSLNITASTFVHNEAETDGAAVNIFSNNLHVTLDNSNFSENFAESGCGAVCLQSDGNSAELNSMRAVNTIFTRNVANHSAGMLVNALSVHLVGCTFDTNTAHRNSSAGGVNAYSIRTLLLEGCTFRNNSACKATCFQLPCCFMMPPPISQNLYAHLVVDVVNVTQY